MELPHQLLISEVRSMSNQRYMLPYSQEFQTDLRFPLTSQYLGDSENPLTLRLLYLSSSRYENDWNCTLHSHSFSELFYITSGKGYFLVKGHKCPVEKNHLIIINPQIEHSEFSSEERPLEYVVLGIEGLQFTPSTTQQEDIPVVHITQADSRIAHCIDGLRDEVQYSRPGQEAICQSLLNIILLLILRQKDIHVAITAFNNVSAECMAIKDYIDSHFKDPITLDLLAQQAHQNKYYVAHTFKEAFGVSPIKYLMERRVEESKYLLEETDYSIGQIASIMGFSSSSHYSQAFRRSTSLSPNEYRKQSRSQSITPIIP